jgi:hypothetical protein
VAMNLRSVDPYIIPKIKNVLFVTPIKILHKEGYKILNVQNKIAECVHNDHKFKLPYSSIISRIKSNSEICSICNQKKSLLNEKIKTNSINRVINILPNDYEYVKYVSKKFQPY